MNIVIAGAGNVCYYLTERLITEGHNITVIDQNPEIVDKICSKFDIGGVVGSASSLECLKRTGIEDADIYIASTASDETNLLSCLLCDGVSKKTTKIARVRDLVTDETGLPPNITDVVRQFINPDKEAINGIMSALELPGANEVIDFADGRLKLIGISLKKDSEVIGQSLKRFASMELVPSMLVLAILRKGTLIVPGGGDVFEAGDIVYLVCKEEVAEDVVPFLCPDAKPVNRVIISGSTPIARGLASKLVHEGKNVKIICEDKDLSDQMADELYGVLVLHGDPSDHNLLEEEGISNTDMFIAATSDDEDNLLSAMLAKNLGASMVGVVVEKVGYLKLVSAIGLDLVVNPRISAASSILKYLRGDGMSLAFSTRDDSAEIVEIKVPEKSKIANRAIRDLSMPSGVIISAIVRPNNEVIVPRGDDIIHEGDDVVFFAQRSVMPKLDKLVGSGGSLIDLIGF